MKNLIMFAFVFLAFLSINVQSKRTKQNFVSSLKNATDTTRISCNNSQYVINNRGKTYLTILYITGGYYYNFTRAYTSSTNKDKWCIVEKTSNSTGLNYSYFLWYDSTNPIELAHVEESTGEWHIEANYWTQNTTSDFKWNITMETTGFNSIRIYQEPDYSLAVDDFGNLYMTEVDINNPYQQWVIKE